MAEKLKQYEILFIKAKEDLVAAKYLLDGFKNHNLDLNLEIIFFHLQQCAEKLIKTILDFHVVQFRKIHDINELLHLSKDSNICLIDDIDSLVDLTDYAVEGRYSLIHEDLIDADKYIFILERLTDFVSQQIYKVS